MKEYDKKDPDKEYVRILLAKAKQDAEFKRVTEKQDGSFAHVLPTVFYGGPFDGQKISHAILMAMRNKGYTPRWSEMRGINHAHDNLALEDQPVIEGYVGPTIDRGCLRYETQEVYDTLSH